ncbi:SDR family oxidoreductase [Actinokineospora xionganensis]|uniref:SDR family oxidoreductase n=1 Tax=Actinokineospora xionganensis TaxID=2684470 RepID=A0ABR7LBX1_9PSEU|nr:SDR family oxidoreductase [Actinokineospora xionganensis]MBC6450196.1 SDR family oxidoreductase [Actinokineospora xionganensis]
MARSLTDQVVVITGGARGIGAATAAALVRAGARVVVADLDADLAKQTAATLTRESPLPAGEFDIRATAYGLDVTDRAAFTALLDQVEAEIGPIDVLVNNAGIMPIALIEDEPDRTTAAQLAVNLHAVIHGSREAVRRMKRRGSGHVVNVASAAGRIPVPAGATYCATKFGVIGFSEALRLELRDTGVDVSCVMPAIVRTELAAGLKDSKGVKPVTAEQVAEAIVGALRSPRFDVYVPKSVGPAVRVGALLPRRVGEWLSRGLGGERLFLDALDSADRRDYEARAADSAPGAEETRG